MKKLIFCYGTLKSGFSNNQILSNAKLLGKAKINGWTMYSLGGFPALTRGDNEIIGEVYEVNDENTLNRVYRLEGYSGARDSSANWYDTEDVDTPYGKAEVFYMKDESKYKYSHPVVKDGVWKGYVGDFNA